MKTGLTTLMTMLLLCFIVSCSKDTFSEKDAVEAQKELLELKYQHELDLETLKQKGATALQQLINQAALDQLRVNDSLTTARNKDARRQDYSVTVVDVISNAPIADADVTVSSEGKVYSAKTNAQGTAFFSALLLYPTSSFTVSKTGYAASQILQQNITQGTVKLWNSGDKSGQIYGTLFIDTDLTTPAPEKVGANVLITASTTVPGSNSSSYTVVFPTYSKADGTFSFSLPIALNEYRLKFEQIEADQTLVVNGTETDNRASFPQSLPRVVKVKTHFDVNSSLVNIPYVTAAYYFKFQPDNNGNTFYLAGNNNYNYFYMSAVGDKFQIERLSINNTGNSVSNTYSYAPNSQVNVDLVDVTGKVVATAPKLMARTDANGKLMSYYSIENSDGLVHLKTDANGAVLPDAKGLILTGTPYYNGSYYISPSQLNYATTYTAPTNILLNNTGYGQKVVVNYYYGAGSSRDVQVY